jgi:hypothetical protein
LKSARGVGLADHDWCRCPSIHSGARVLTRSSVVACFVSISARGTGQPRGLASCKLVLGVVPRHRSSRDPCCMFLQASVASRQCRRIITIHHWPSLHAGTNGSPQPQMACQAEFLQITTCSEPCKRPRQCSWSGLVPLTRTAETHHWCRPRRAESWRRNLRWILFPPRCGPRANLKEALSPLQPRTRTTCCYPDAPGTLPFGSWDGLRDITCCGWQFPCQSPASSSSSNTVTWGQ